MKPYELNPDKYNIIINKKKKEEDKINNQATSTVYTCKKCKKINVKLHKDKLVQQMNLLQHL